MRPVAATRQPVQLAMNRRDYQREYMRRRRAERPDIRLAEAERAKQKRIANPEAARLASKRWRAGNPDKVVAQRQRELPEKKKSRWRKYYDANRDKLLERARIARQKHPEWKRMSQRKRKAMRAASKCDLSPSDISAIVSVPCRKCGAASDLTLAHDIPVSRGGETTRENCFSLCRSCNSRMHTKTWNEFVNMEEKHNGVA